MDVFAYTYLIYGALLVVVFVAIIGYYYGRKRHEQVEKAKYTMLDDE